MSCELEAAQKWLIFIRARGCKLWTMVVPDLKLDARGRKSPEMVQEGKSTSVFCNMT